MRKGWRVLLLILIAAVVVVNIDEVIKNFAYPSSLIYWAVFYILLGIPSFLFHMKMLKPKKRMFSDTPDNDALDSHLLKSYTEFSVARILWIGNLLFGILNGLFALFVFVMNFIRPNGGLDGRLIVALVLIVFARWIIAAGGKRL